MSKELTEQWRNGTLEDGDYYVRREYDTIIDYYYNNHWEWIEYEQEVKEVLAPVPDYYHFVELTEKADQFSQLVKKVEPLEQLLESETLAKQEGVERVAELEDRLKEAEKVIKFYADAQPLTEEEKQMTAEKYHLVYGLKACDYLERYGVE